MKKLFYFLIPILSFFSIQFIGIQTVNAFSLDIKPKVCVRDISGSVNCSYKGEIAKFWDNNYWTTTNYLGSVGSTAPINNLISFQWPNYNLCQGKSFLISGYIGGLFGYFDANSSYEFYNNSTQMNCSYTKIDSSRLKFTCSGIGGGDFLVNFNLNSFSSGTNYQPAISQNVDITCNATNDTIITENKQNTQDIINNQNQNKNDIINNQNNNQAQTNQGLDNINGSLNNSDISGANEDLNKFTENDAFKDNTGILAIIQAPINMLNSLTSTTCSPLSLPIPFLNVDLDIPCLSSIFTKHLSTELLTLLKLSINGFLVYKILCSFVMDIHNYKDPDSDRLEVLDL